MTRPHIEPFIELNENYKKYPYSSIDYYIGRKSSDWVQPDEIKDMFKEARQGYLDFLEDYEDKKAELEEVKRELY